MTNPTPPRTPAMPNWNQRFDSEEYFYGTEANAFLRAQAGLLQAGQQVLAVADGEGRNGVWLAEQGLQVTAVEASSNALKKARKLAAERGVAPEFIEADLLSWRWPAAEFDVVAAIFIQFLAAAARERVFAAMHAALKPGGILLLQGYTVDQLNYRTGGPAVAEQLYTPELIRELLAGMEIVHLREHVGELQEGTGHCGQSALLDVVARKPAQT